MDTKRNGPLLGAVPEDHSWRAADETERSTVLGLPEGACCCPSPPDRIVTPEPSCCRERRRELTRRRLRHLARDWRYVSAPRRVAA
jgi:hypothetical protein